MEHDKHAGPESEAGGDVPKEGRPSGLPQEGPKGEEEADRALRRGNAASEAVEAAPVEGEMDMAEALARFEGEKSQGARPQPQSPGTERRQGGSGGGWRGADRRGRDREGRPSPRESRRERQPRQQSQQQAQPQAFKREILANTSFEETRVAIVENGRLVELLWERRSAQSIVGNIYKGRVENVLPGISSAFVNIGFEKNAYLYISDVLGDTRQGIDQLIKKGQEIMVQVAKEAIGTKGMKVTMDVSLPGRYLVFAPLAQSVGISKQIIDSVERKRISDIMDRLGSELKGRGVVVRTEAEGAGEEDLRREVQYLLRTWEAIEGRTQSLPAPALLHKDLDIAMQVARDLLTDEVYVYLLDDRESHQNAVDFVAKISPDLKERVRLYDAKTPIFTAFNIEPEIEKLRQTKVSLPNGGTIVIQEAESLCAIDVNTGRFTGSKSQEETVTATNVEAAEEIAHQLRLRNIGGIVVIDFIDMKKASNRNRVMEALAQAVRRDRAKIRILPITRLGLIEMTRERRRESTVSLLTEDCPECRGSGRVLSTESIRIRIQREIHELTQGRPGGNVRIVLHPLLAEAFRSCQEQIEKNVHRAVKITGDPNLIWEDYRIILE